MAGPDIGSVIGQLVGGGAGGAILTAIVGAIKNTYEQLGLKVLLPMAARGNSLRVWLSRGSDFFFFFFFFFFF